MKPKPERAARGLYWDRAWSLVENCTPVSRGCDHCWSRAMGGRFGRPWDGKTVRFREDRIEIPFQVKRPTIFTLWNDLFHEAVTDAQIAHALEVVQRTPRHLFLVLTKRPERVAENFQVVGRVRGPTNVWIGTSVEDQAAADERIPRLLQVPAALRFVSYEPALGPVDFGRWLRIAWRCSGCGNYFPNPWKKTCPSCGRGDYWCGSHEFNPPSGQVGSGIGWLIAGGETGPGARECDPCWLWHASEQCLAAGVPFWFKSYGPSEKHQVPNYCERREFPEVGPWASERLKEKS
jgi:protein gp37